MQYQILSYQDLRKIVWFIADTIRDKGRGNSNDYMAITVGILFLKRMMDMRAEHKRKFITKGTSENSILLLSGQNIDKAIASHQSKYPEFEVDTEKLWTYRIEWKDLANFSDNTNAKELVLDYFDGLGGNQYTTSVENKVKLLKECIDGFKHHTIHDIFDTLDLISKVYSTQRKQQVLDLSDFESLITELDKYRFDIEHANQDVFADVYMDLLGRFASDGGKKGGEFFTPTKVVRGAIKFLDMKFKSHKIMVSDLTAGACTFMVEFAKVYKDLFSDYFKDNKEVKFNDYIEFVTGEKEPISKVLGDGNLLLNGYSNNHTSFHANSITEYKTRLGPKTKDKVDVILANPPYGLNDYGIENIKSEVGETIWGDRWKFGVPNKGEGEYAFMMTILDMLNDEGKAVVVMPLGTLFKDITSTYREKIIAKDWLEGIVALPKGLFLTTNIPVCLWILNKKKDLKDQNKVFLVNAENDFVKVGKVNEWDDAKSVNSYLSREEIKNYSGYLNIEKIVKHKYNLSVNRYFTENEIKEEVNLEEINNEIKDLLSSIFTDSKELNKLVEDFVKLSKD